MLSTAGNVAASAQATLTHAFGADAIIDRIPTAGDRSTLEPKKRDLYFCLILFARVLEHHLNISAVVTDGVKGGAKLCAMLDPGACATQLGTVFVLCP